MTMKAKPMKGFCAKPLGGPLLVDTCASNEGLAWVLAEGALDYDSNFGAMLRKTFGKEVHWQALKEAGWRVVPITVTED